MSVTRDQAVLQVRGLQLRPTSQPFDWNLAAGMLVGVAGLEGHGQSDFIGALCGLYQPSAGEVITSVTGRGARHIRSLSQAAKAGITYLPRDRKSQGILPTLSILDNFALPTLEEDTTFGFVRRSSMVARFNEFKARLAISDHPVDSPITTLSGGNQQKVLLARWLAARPKVLILDDPSRGVDLGTKRTLYTTFRDVVASGTALVFLSTEIEELVEMCSEVLVFREGQLFTTIDRADLDYAAIISAMFGRADAP